LARTLNIENSQITLHEEIDNCWLMDAENLMLYANNSSIFIQGAFNGFVTKNGTDIEFGNIYLHGNFDTIQNINNHVYYDCVQVDSNFCCITGNFEVGSLSINGQQFSLEGEPEIDYVNIASGQMVIPEGLNIGTIISNGWVTFSGSNNVEFAKLSRKAYFYGENYFDTLIITASYGGFETSGGLFYFQSGKTQTIFDSLYIRGHPCENIHIRATIFDSLAYIRKDYGLSDISCDFLVIQNIAAMSETLDFYTGSFSSIVPNPEDPPPGWIYDNAPGYSYGIGGGPYYDSCIGDTIVISTQDFNGNDSTLFYWNFDTVPGENYYLATESEVIYLRVVLAPGCTFDDTLIMVFDTCENNINENLDTRRINLYPNPATGKFYLQTQNFTDDFEIVLSDIKCVNVFREMVIPKSLDYTKSFECSNLNKGVYFLAIRAIDRTITKKLVIY
jgi:hypothetical protein